MQKILWESSGRVIRRAAPHDTLWGRDSAAATWCQEARTIQRVTQCDTSWVMVSREHWQVVWSHHTTCHAVWHVVRRGTPCPTDRPVFSSNVPGGVARCVPRPQGTERTYSFSSNVSSGGARWVTRPQGTERTLWSLVSLIGEKKLY